MSKPSELTHPNRGAFPQGMSGPSLRALANAGVHCMDDLARWSEADLASLHGMGPKTLMLLREALTARYGQRADTRSA